MMTSTFIPGTLGSVAFLFVANLLIAIKSAVISLQMRDIYAIRRRFWNIVIYT